MVNTKILVIGDAPLATGFRLAGLEHVIETVPEEFSKELEKAFKSNEFGVIVVNEKMFDDIDWKLRRAIEAKPYPIIITIPDISGPSAKAEDIRALVKRALGVDIIK